MPFTNLRPYSGLDQVTVGNGHIPIFHIGNMFLSYSSQQFKLQNVLHVSQISTNLVSVSRFCTDNNVFFEFHSNHFVVKDQVSKQILLQGHLKDGLCILLAQSSSLCAFISTHLQDSTDTVDVWQSCLGHPAFPIVSKVLNICNPSFHSNKINDSCVFCPLAKAHQLPFLLSNSHASCPLELLHLNLWGPAPCPSTSGARYFLIIIDDFSRYIS